jgi:hypothetical protein
MVNSWYSRTFFDFIPNLENIVINKKIAKNIVQVIICFNVNLVS